MRFRFPKHYPVRTVFARQGRLIATASIIIASGGCSTASVIGIAGSAVTAGMEAAGLKPVSKQAQPQSIRITLNAGESLNTTDDGRSLALLVKVYQLRSVQSFASVHADVLLDRIREHESLGQDLLAVREITLTPGARHSVDEPLADGAQNIGVVAMFRAPAARRWRYAFDASRSIETGISLGFHGCAMTVGAGSLSGAETDTNVISLAGVHCVGSTRPPSTAHPAAKHFPG